MGMKLGMSGIGLKMLPMLSALCPKQPLAVTLSICEFLVFRAVPDQANPPPCFAQTMVD